MLTLVGPATRTPGVLLRWIQHCQPLAVRAAQCNAAAYHHAVQPDGMGHGDLDPCPGVSYETMTLMFHGNELTCHISQGDEQLSSSECMHVVSGVDRGIGGGFAVAVAAI